MEGDVDPPPDEPADQRRDHAFGAERRLVPPAELEHVRGAHEGDPHQRGHARRAARQRRGPQEPAPPATAIAEARAGSDAEIRRRRLGAHRLTKTDGGEDGHDANRRQAPGEALLLAGGGHDVAGDVGLDGAARKRSPGGRPSRLARGGASVRVGVSLALQNTCSTSTVSARPMSGTTMRTQVTWLETKSIVRLEHQGHGDDEDAAGQAAQQPTERGGGHARPARPAAGDAISLTENLLGSPMRAVPWRLPFRSRRTSRICSNTDVDGRHLPSRGSNGTHRRGRRC